jgi:transposase
MCWAGVSGEFVTDLYFSEPDELSFGGGTTTRTYLIILDEALPRKVRDGSAIFPYNGASIHDSHEANAWLEKRGFACKLLPPNSPDLNIIEHCWPHLKRWTHELHPELENMRGNKPAKKAALKLAMQEGWQRVKEDTELIKNLVESIPKRWDKCIAADGLQTRY